MKKIVFCFLLAILSGASYANCAWGNCTPAQLQQEYQQNQLNQLNSINNSLQQIQRQQQQVPALGQWSNTPSAPPLGQWQNNQIQPLTPNPWAAPPMTQQVTPCYVDALGRMNCR